MPRKETRVQKIVRIAAQRFPSFGGGKAREGNPLSLVLKNEPPAFAAGVSIEQVVRFVLTKRDQLVYAQHRKNAAENIDARDPLNTAPYLYPLSNRALSAIKDLKATELKRCLAEKAHPFRRLDKATREILRHLPYLWVLKAADILLEERQRHRKSRTS